MLAADGDHVHDVRALGGAQQREQVLRHQDAAGRAGGQRVGDLVVGGRQQVGALEPARAVVDEHVDAVRVLGDGALRRRRSRPGRRGRRRRRGLRSLPRAAISSHVRWAAASRLRAASSSSAPRSAKCSASARPKSRPAPVTTMRTPSKLIGATSARGRRHLLARCRSAPGGTSPRRYAMACAAHSASDGYATSSSSGRQVSSIAVRTPLPGIEAHDAQRRRDLERDGLHEPLDGELARAVGRKAFLAAPPPAGGDRDERARTAERSSPAGTRAAMFATPPALTASALLEDLGRELPDRRGRC